MPLIIIIVAFIALKYFEIGPFANLSWWWAAGLFALAYIWFEFGEKIFGLDTRKADDETEKMRKDRVSKEFKKLRK
ncbi:MAG: TIGR04438 family Trp-rich protein [Janthinobacterium lividum]